MLVVPYGVSAALVQVDDLSQVISLDEDLKRDPIKGVLEVVPAARTLLLRYDASVTGIASVAANISSRSLKQVDSSSHGEVTEVPVSYAGDDLEEVAELIGITPREVIERHTDPEYRVAFIGMAPGFYFLAGGDPLLQVPRRNSPRVCVPLGGVGLAGEFTGIYPRLGPGGWQLIGTTYASLWDADRFPSALLSPGTRIRFVNAGRPC